MAEEGEELELELAKLPEERDILDPADRTLETYQIIMAELKVLKRLEGTYEQRVRAA